MIIKRKDASAVISKLDEVVRTHPSFLLDMRSTRPDARRDYVLRASDGERSIALAVLPVVLVPEV
jgi:hypothetical protein